MGCAKNAAAAAAVEQPSNGSALAVTVPEVARRYRSVSNVFSCFFVGTAAPRIETRAYR